MKTTNGFQQMTPDPDGSKYLIGAGGSRVKAHEGPPAGTTWVSVQHKPGGDWTVTAYRSDGLPFSATNRVRTAAYREVRDELAPPFDWSRIDAAVAAIPPGRWTTYGDLARLAGTTSRPVGRHVASVAAGLDTAYRVLGAEGKPRPDFHWDDPGDQPTQADALSADGVRFDAKGAADPSQRMTAEELVVATRPAGTEPR